MIPKLEPQEDENEDNTGKPVVVDRETHEPNSPEKMSLVPDASNRTGEITYPCIICGFTSTSKFHFNSHMNTHADHQCSMCDYTSRTEGRLKRHMKDFHSRAEKISAGVSPTTELLEPPQLSSAQAGTPSVMEQMLQAVIERQEAFDLHSQSAGSGSPTGIPMIDREMRQSTSNNSKSYRCKHCTHTSQSKEESWQHARSHISRDKLLTCSKCPFVTQYKHHLEYHLLTHSRRKPFRCKKCSYSCVNKSMLKSHMKSHSSFYPFSCRDCAYSTKYCHTLKLHLRKYGHQPMDIPYGSTLDVNAAIQQGPNPNETDNLWPQLNSPDMASAPLLESLLFQQMSGVTKTITMGAQLPTIQGDWERINPDKGAVAQEGSMELGGSHSLEVQLLRVPGDWAAVNSEKRTIHESFAQEGNIEVGGSHQKCNMCGYRSTSQEDYVQHLFIHKLESVFNNSSTAEPVAAANAVYNQQGSADGEHALTSNREVEGLQDYSPSIKEKISPSHQGSQRNCRWFPIHKGSDDNRSYETLGQNQEGGNSRKKGKPYKPDQIDLRVKQINVPSAHSSEQKEMEGMDVQVEDREESVEQSEVGLEIVEVVPSVIQTQPQQILVPPKYSIAEEIRGRPSLQGPFKNALEFIVEKQQTGNEEHGKKEGVSESGESEGGERGWGTACLCDHCQIVFKNAVMYHVHMGYHGYENPFQCNRCGQVCQDSLSMFVHIAQAEH